MNTVLLSKSCAITYPNLFIFGFNIPLSNLSDFRQANLYGDTEVAAPALPTRAWSIDEQPKPGHRVKS